MAQTRRNPISPAPDASSRRGKTVGRRYRFLAAIFVALIILAAAAVALYQFAYAGRVYPGVVTADSLSLGALTRVEAAEALTAHSSPQLTRRLQLRYGGEV